MVCELTSPPFKPSFFTARSSSFAAAFGSCGANAANPQ